METQDKLLGGGEKESSRKGQDTAGTNITSGRFGSHDVPRNVESNAAASVAGPRQIFEHGENENPLEKPSIADMRNSDDWTELSETVFMCHNEQLHPHAEVYRGRRVQKLGEIQEVVIKHWKPLKGTYKNDIQEVDILKRLAKYPHVVKVLEWGAFNLMGRRIFIAMEACLQNLSQYINENPFVLQKAARFFQQAVSAIVYIHKNSITHRDLKPSNILISLDGNNVKVSDFGISRELAYGRRDVTVTYAGAGTTGFRAPETYLANSKISLKVDIFSLAICGGIMMTHGEHPFGPESSMWEANIKFNQNLDLSHIPEFPEPNAYKRQLLINLFTWMLKPDPEDRPTALQVYEDIFFKVDETVSTPQDHSTSETSELVDGKAIGLHERERDCENSEQMGAASNGDAPVTGRQENKDYSKKLSIEDIRNPEDWTKLSETVFMRNDQQLRPYAEVFRGKRERDSGEMQEIVIKLLKTSEETYNREAREVDILNKLADHPHVVKILESGVFQLAGLRIFIVMEVCLQNLSDYINENLLSLPKSTRFFEQTVSAIDFIHHNKIVHLDLKPSNILITYDEENVKVSDFGISTELNGRHDTTDTYAGAGTNGFRAPETYPANRKISLKADIFSLAICGGIMMTHGKHPFGPEPSMWQTNINFNQNLDLSHIPEFPEPKAYKRQLLTNLITWMLKPDPEDRPTALQVYEDMFFKVDETVSTPQDHATSETSELVNGKAIGLHEREHDCENGEQMGAASNATSDDHDGDGPKKVKSHHSGKSKDNVFLHITLFWKTSGELVCMMWSDDYKKKKVYKKFRDQSYTTNQVLPTRLSVKTSDEVELSIQYCQKNQDDKVRGPETVSKVLLVRDVTMPGYWAEHFAPVDQKHFDLTFSIQVGNNAKKEVPVRLECGNEGDILKRMDEFSKHDGPIVNLSVASNSITNRTAHTNVESGGTVDVAKINVSEVVISPK